ncbi:MAG: hypothetical protein ISR82_03830 [Candidatus Marinimicrobia bacterium]|nr:hypothetical protein [Candidatus Neomarinimicrobiota bacterium]MBL7010334.1 hypothetical protein [Candidatus Neomarinimicrobiota bacterium]MBL7030038.1 hypothetical protein [Candidatus Neomarinimicrobiota bacterium]
MIKRIHLFRSILNYTLIFTFTVVGLLFYGCEKVKDDGNGGGSGEFPKQVTVFGVKVLGSEKISESKVLHAAKILAQYLDNDEDGNVDNPIVTEKLVSVGATIVMFENESDADNSNYNMPAHDHIQDLYGEETIPSFNKNGINNRFDASLEEVLHLVTHEGFSVIYPHALGEKKGSDLANAMDAARGGYFENIPSNYPDGAWYTYQDESCEYDCMVTEYFYWSLTTFLGAQSYSGRKVEIQHEWKYNIPELLKANDPTVYEIMRKRPELNLPRVLPDAIYNGFEINLD